MTVPISVIRGSSPRANIIHLKVVAVGLLRATHIWKPADVPTAVWRAAHAGAMEVHDPLRAIDTAIETAGTRRMLGVLTPVLPAHPVDEVRRRVGNKCAEARVASQVNPLCITEVTSHLPTHSPSARTPGECRPA